MYNLYTYEKNIQKEKLEQIKQKKEINYKNKKKLEQRKFISNYKDRIQNFIFRMVQEPVVIKNFKSSVEDSVKTCSKSSSQGFIFRQHMTDMERVSKYLKGKNYSQRSQSNIPDNSPPKKLISVLPDVQQPNMKFKHRTELERLYDAINDYSYGRVSHDIIQKQLEKMHYYQLKRLIPKEEIILYSHVRNLKSKYNGNSVNDPAIQKKLMMIENMKKFLKQNENLQDEEVENKRKYIDNSLSKQFMTDLHVKTHFKGASMFLFGHGNELSDFTAKSSDNSNSIKEKNTSRKPKDETDITESILDNLNSARSWRNYSTSREILEVNPESYNLNEIFKPKKTTGDKDLVDEKILNYLKDISSSNNFPSGQGSQSKCDVKNDITSLPSEENGNWKKEDEDKIAIDGEILPKRMIDIIAKKVLRKCNYLHGKSMNNNQHLQIGNGKLAMTNGLTINQFMKAIHYPINEQMMNSILDTLWPVKDFLNFTFKTLLENLIKNEVNIDTLERDIKAKSFCEVNNLCFNEKEITKLFFLNLPIEVTNLQVESLYIKFPMTFLKDKIQLKISNMAMSIQSPSYENMNANLLLQMIQDRLVKKKGAELIKLPAPIEKLINNAINNVDVYVNNISISYKSSCELSPKYLLLINKVTYSNYKPGSKDGLFIYNKQISGRNVLLKQNSANEKDDCETFFKLCEENSPKIVEYFTGKDCLLVLSDKPEESFNFTFSQDTVQKEKLVITANLGKCELILTKSQFSQLAQNTYFFVEMYKKISSVLQNISISKDETSYIEHEIQPSSVELFHSQISSIYLNINLQFFYLLVLEHSNTDNFIKPKIWFQFENFFKKFYLQDGGSSDTINTIEKHFCYFEENFFLLHVNKINIGCLFNLHTNENESKFSFGDVSLRYIEPNFVPVKMDMIIINNVINNETERLFDEKYSKILLNVMKTGYYGNSLLSILNERISSDLHFPGVELWVKNSIKIKCEDSSKISKNIFRSNFLKILTTDINFDLNHFILLKLYALAMVRMDEYQAIVQANEKSFISAYDVVKLGDSPKKDHKKATALDPSGRVVNERVRKGSVLDKVLQFEKKLIHKKEAQQLSFLPKQKDDEEVVYDDTPTQTKLLFIFQEFKIAVNFKLNVRILTLNNGSQWLRDYYDHCLSKLFKDNYNFPLGHTYTSTIGDNIANDHLLIRIQQSEILSNKNFLDKHFNVYITISQLLALYNMKNFYFPFLIYKNNNHPSLVTREDSESEIQAIDEYFANVGTVKNFDIGIITKNYIDHGEFQANFSNQLKFRMNGHHILKNETFFLDDLQTNAKITQELIMECRVPKVDLIVNPTYLKQIIEFFHSIFYTNRFFFTFAQTFHLKNFPNNTLNTIESSNDETTSLNFKVEFGEINLIGFSNLNANLLDSNIDRVEVPLASLSSYLFVDHFLQVEENIFKLIDNPIFKAQVIQFNTSILSDAQSYLISSIDNVKVLIRKNDNVFHDIKIKHQIFFQGVYEQENFEYLLTKGKGGGNLNQNLITLMMKFSTMELKPQCHFNFDSAPNDIMDYITLFSKFQNQNKIQKTHIVLNVDDIIFSPFFFHFDESLKHFEEIKRDYYKMKILLGKVRPSGWKYLKYDHMINEKLFANWNIHSKWDFSLNVDISRIIIDLFSAAGNKNLAVSSITPSLNCENLIDKMRLITELSDISIVDNRNDSQTSPRRLLEVRVGKMNSIFMKNLDFKKESYGSLVNRCHNISNEISIWRKLGFTEIFTMDEIQCSLTNIKDLTRNFKLELISNCIQFYFCQDSFDYFKQFLTKSISDVTTLCIHYSTSEADKDSVITELEMIQDKLITDQINFKGAITKEQCDHTIEFRKVGRGSRSDFQNQANWGIRSLTPHKKEDDRMVLDDSTPRRHKKKQSKERSEEDDYQGNFHSDTEMYKNVSEKSQNSEMFSPLNMENSFASIIEKLNIFFIFKCFKFYILDGEDFNFQGSYNRAEIGDIGWDEGSKKIKAMQFEVLDDYFAPEKVIHKKLGSSQKNKLIENINPRNYYNYVLLEIDDFTGKFFYYDNSPVIFSHLMEIHSFSIEDGLRNSHFKRILSNYNFEDTDIQFFTLKLDLIQNIKNQFEMNIFLELTPLNILIDQHTWKFIIEFFKFSLEENLESALDDNPVVELTIQDSLSQNISQIQPPQIKFKKEQNIIPFPTNINAFFARRVIVQEFFLNFCYYTRDLSFANLRERKLYEFLNISSINDLKLDFKQFDFNGSKKLTEVLEDLAKFWKEDILKSQLINAYLSSITLLRPFKNIIGGVISMFTNPYKHYEEDKSVQEGVVEGVRNFVIGFTTEVALLGENLYNFLRGVFGTTRKKKGSIYRECVYYVNEKKKRRDEYFLKD